MANVHHEGDRVIVIHSHEIHPPVLPRKYNEYTQNKIKGGQGFGGGRGGGRNKQFLLVFCKIEIARLFNSQAAS